MGNFDVLAHTELTSASSEIELASIDGSYQHLFMTVKVRDTSTTDPTQWLNMRLNSTSSGVYDHGYAGFTATGRESAGSVLGGAGQFYIGRSVTDHSGNAANSFATAEVWIPYYTDTGIYTNYLSHHAFLAKSGNNDYSQAVIHWGQYESTSAITNIKIYVDTGNLDTGTEVTLYGIASA